MSAPEWVSDTVTYPVRTMLRYEFNLTVNDRVVFYLPRDLTVADVRRLTAFLETLPIPTELAEGREKEGKNGK